MPKMYEATPKQKKIAKKYFKLYDKVANKYWQQVADLEQKLSLEMRIPNMEFFFVDNEMVGIGNGNRTLKLIQKHDISTKNV